MIGAKHIGIGLLYGVAWILSAVHLLAERPDYIEPDFSSAKPVRMEILQDGGKRTLGARFVRPSSSGVEIEMLEGDGTIIVGWDHMEQFTINIPMTEMLERALSHRDPVKRVEALKEEVWPLLPLASIRSESTNVHILINAYIKAIIQSKDWLGGYDMSQYMALNRSPQETVKHLYLVAENLFLIEEQEKALNLIDQLTASRPPKEFRTLGLGVAERMLDMRLFEPALRLYTTIAQTTSGLERKKTLLTCSYLHLEIGALDDAERILKEARAITEASEETVGMEYLCTGVQSFLVGDTAQALNQLGHSMAFLPPDSRIQQSGLYYIYLSYWNQEQPEIAKNILDEMGLLFPAGAYTALLVKEPESIESIKN